MTVSNGEISQRSIELPFRCEDIYPVCSDLDDVDLLLLVYPLVLKLLIILVDQEHFIAFYLSIHQLQFHLSVELEDCWCGYLYLFKCIAFGYY